MAAIRGEGVLRTLLQAALLGVVYCLIASPAVQLADSSTLAAIVWPAPTLAIALLWRRPPKQWPIYLLCVFIAMIEVGNRDWLSLESDVGFAALNVLEVALCAWLGQRYVAADGNLESVSQLIRFLLLLPIAAIALVAVLGASIASAAMNTSWWQEWRMLMVGNGVAVLVLVPALLAWYRPAVPTRTRLASASTLGTIAGIASVTVALLVAACLPVSEEVLRMMLSLILVSTAIYGGMKSASLTVGVAAALGIALTLFRLGPYGLDDADSTWRLQVDLAGLAVLSFFVAIAVRERNRLAVRLEQARRFESLGMLAGGIAHDFNNILGAVRGYAEMAEERLPVSSPAQSPLREVVSAAARGKDLTEQILLAARRGDRVRAVLDLRDIAREAVALATPLCPPGITLTLRLPPNPLPVLAHRDQMARAALNLIRNATQASRSRVVVIVDSGVISARNMAVGDAPANAAAWIEVRDDGTGIAPEHMPHLFDPFFSTRSGVGKGTGLGLAIVAGIATEHDGGVAITTGAAGTQFLFVLPLNEVKPEVKPDAKLEAQPGQRPEPGIEHSPEPSREHYAEPPRPTVIGNGERVILLDDDRALRERSEEWLAELGFEPVGYDDPHQALVEAAAAPHEIFLLLTDIDMPTMRGDDLAARMREHAPELPVILCSGNPRLGNIAHATRAVALAKPFDQAALARATLAAITRQR